jgi:hypothetical protein
MMDRYQVSVAQDHILSLTKFRNPLVAIEELIWNSLDEDATEVKVDLVQDRLHGLRSIIVTDNGHGLRRDRCVDAFGNVGGSPKLHIKTTPSGRIPHGKFGRGRFRAFGIGRTVTWTSRFKDNGDLFEYEIKCHKSTIRDFEVTDAVRSINRTSGVTVEISAIDDRFPSLLDPEAAASELALRVALYLRKYPGIAISYDGLPVDPESMEEHTAQYQIDVLLPSKETFPAQLIVIEWRKPVKRAVYLCDEQGFALDEQPPGIKAKGYSFTAYLRTPVVGELDRNTALGAGELHPTVKAILDAAKECLKEHFRKRDASRVVDLVRKWQEERIYPYEKISADPLETAEREVFDVCAAKVFEYLPGFETAEHKAKKLTFRLIQQALETNPTSLQTILREILALPQEQQDELAELLERTTLSAILNAATVVVDRLRFLQSLDQLLFGVYRDTLLEARHLHRILSQELWIFGEQYDRGIDEGSLTNLLRKHIQLLGRKELVPVDEPVVDSSGNTRRIDLMLHSRYPLQPARFEHLVVELKRPNVIIGQEEIGQIENYAITVTNDERFDKEHVRWKFLLLGNQMDAFATTKCNATGREFGHILSGNVDVYVNTWSTIIERAKWRYEFFRKQLEYQATTNDGLAYVRKKYWEHLPPSGVV